MKIRFCLMFTLILISSAILFAQADNRVFAGGYEVLTIKVPAKRITVPERASIVQARIVNVLNNTETAPLVSARKLKDGSMQIYSNSKLIVTVQKKDAIADKTTIPVLAEKWANSISLASASAMSLFDHVDAKKELKDVSIPIGSKSHLLKPTKKLPEKYKK